MDTSSLEKQQTFKRPSSDLRRIWYVLWPFTGSRQSHVLCGAAEKACCTAQRFYIAISTNRLVSSHYWSFFFLSKKLLKSCITMFSGYFGLGTGTEGPGATSAKTFWEKKKASSWTHSGQQPLVLSLKNYCVWKLLHHVNKGHWIFCHWTIRGFHGKRLLSSPELQLWPLIQTQKINLKITSLGADGCDSSRSLHYLVDAEHTFMAVK